MKVTYKLSIGYPGADHEEEMDYTDEEWSEMSENDREKDVEFWAWNYIEMWYEEEE